MRKTTRGHWLLTTTVNAGWVGKRQFKTYKSAVYRSTPVHHQESVEHYRDTYTTYGDDPSLPDALRSHATTTVSTGRQTWTETNEHTTYESTFDGYEDRVDAWTDVAYDGGGQAQWRWRGVREGDRVYSVTVTLFGHYRWLREHNASQDEWSAKEPFGWKLLGQDARAIIKADVDTWRERVRRIKPQGVSVPMLGLKCVDGVATVLDDGQVLLRYGGIRQTGPQRKECLVEDGDLLLLVIPENGEGMAAMHNVRTGDTWRNPNGVSDPGITMIARTYAATAAATAACIGVLQIGRHYDAGLYGMAVAIVPAVGAYMMWKRAKDRMDYAYGRARHNRERADTTVRQIRNMAWLCIRSLPPLAQRQ
jgi:hypothetical protein